MRTASLVNSQSSMNSQRCARAYDVSKRSKIELGYLLTFFFTVRHEFDEIEHAFHNAPLELVATFFAEYAA